MTLSVRQKLILALLALVVGLVTAFGARRHLAMLAFALLEPAPGLSARSEEPAPVRWFDDYYTIEHIDADTIAIGEPRYWQVNYSYLILGESRAILFDSGPGVRDIAPVVAAHTSVPVTVVASHLHYDHIGNHGRFGSLALPDLAHLRQAADGNRLQPSRWQHLGFTEGIEAPTLAVSEWWTDAQTLDLGGRVLTVLHTPGHTPDSMMLYDAQRQQLFSGDYLYEGPLYAFLPGSSLADYLRTATRLLELIPSETLILSAHRNTPPGAPRLARSDLQDLRDTLERIRTGSIQSRGLFPRSYPVNERVWLLTDVWTD